MQKVIFLLLMMTLSVPAKASDAVAPPVSQLVAIEPSEKDMADIPKLEKGYIYEAAKRGFKVNFKNIIYVYVNEKSEIIATCYRLTPKFRFIAINLRWWRKYSYMNKELVAFHEFSHCIHYRDHSEDPGSLMYKYKMDIGYYIANREKIMDELFDPNRVGELNRREPKKLIDAPYNY